MLHPSHAPSCSLLPEGTHCHMAFNKSHCSSRSPKYLSVCLQLPLNKWIFDRIWKWLVGMTPNMVIKTLFMNLAVLRPIFSIILSFIVSVLSDTVYDLCPPEPLWHGAMSISLFPSISSSVVLVGVTQSLAASWLAFNCCHTGLRKQSSCYWCRPFTLSGSLHARSSTAGPRIMVRAHAIGARDTLGQHKLPCGVQIHNLVLVRGPPVPSEAGRLVTDRSGSLWHVGSQSRKLWYSAINAQWTCTAEEMGLEGVQTACRMLSRGDLTGLLWTSRGRLF